MKAENISQTEGHPLSYEAINAKHDDNQEAAMADARRAIESSADFTRGGTPPVPDHDATERQRAERIEAEQRRLIAWAKAHVKAGGGRRKAFNRRPERFNGTSARVYRNGSRYPRQRGFGVTALESCA